ncbi:MAG: ADP-ribosylglycohydrolase family protein [Armatimonadetes bacterium]|nr:ADP-ribosylglycohydrolase family protein [Armatimonadota bacterium]MDW8121959.1 ADP-ribosylglycohydrolase family protein [Armatimonadota bacterium]
MVGVLNRKDFWNRVYACWMGKNAGGTLGAPVEGQLGPHQFDWYPRLQEGGIPNDDLEMQLVWLDAVRKGGWMVNSSVLAQAWLTHIGYNWCEYGIAKRNLRWGLLPPISGAYDNEFFNDCMGSPIRSEIWACLAPAAPRLAARFAAEDAFVDHAGGEGVWGEMFFAALESAAFAIRDLDYLLDLALSYIPPQCLIHQAISRTREWWAETKDWLRVREKILEKFGHREPTHAPQNLAFTVLGLLAGRDDFGKVITTAVNCGQDTDCTGATSGAIAGILLGQLPEKWTAPLGEQIATNASWGGIRNFTAPPDIRALTDLVVDGAQRLLAFHGAPIIFRDDAPTDFSRLPRQWWEPDDSIVALWEFNRNPWRFAARLKAFSVTVDYGGPPTVNPEAAKKVTLWLNNHQATVVSVKVEVDEGRGWLVEPNPQWVGIAPESQAAVHFSVHCPAQPPQAHTLFARLLVEGRPAEVAVPITFIGEHRWELLSGDGSAKVEWVRDSQLPLSRWLADEGRVRTRIWLRSPNDQVVHLGFPCNRAFELWLNGVSLLKANDPDYLVRPVYQGPPSHFRNVVLLQGWNQVVVEVTGDPEGADAYLIISDPSDLYKGVTDVVRSQAPPD